MSVLTETDLLRMSELRQALASGRAAELRQRFGLSQGEVAAAIGVTASCVSHWEAGRRVPGTNSARRYARLLGALETADEDRQSRGDGQAAIAS